MGLGKKISKLLFGVHHQLLLSIPRVRSKMTEMLDVRLRSPDPMNTEKSKIPPMVLYVTEGRGSCCKMISVNETVVKP